MSIYDFSSVDDLQRQNLLRLNGNAPYFRNGVRVSQSGDYGVLNSQLVDEQGGISLASGVKLVGGSANTMSEAGFAFVSQNPFVNSVTLYWDGTNGSKLIVQRRTDGSRAPVPAGSVVLSGLAASTRYYFLPFWQSSNQCSIGFVPGTVGTPQILFTNIANRLDEIQAQSLGGREPLSSGFLYFDTPAAGGSGGGSGGSGGAPGLCVMLGTDIEPLDGADYVAKHIPCHEWWHLVTERGRSLYCTPNHPVYTWDGHRIEASAVKIGDKLTTIDGDSEVIKSERHIRSCTKVQISMEHGSSKMFWANGILSHNMKFNTL